MQNRKVLLISNSEICYNPRLAKAADSFAEKGYRVEVFNPVTGIAEIDVYQQFIRDKKWSVIAFDISKRSTKSKLNWLYVSVLAKIFYTGYKYFRWHIGFEYILNKGLLGLKKKHYQNADIIIVHLVASLPFAAKIQRKTNKLLIYDSQEFFTGQFSTEETTIRNWVNEAEKYHIHQAQIVLATTNVMAKKIAEKYQLKQMPIRVRNLPQSISIDTKHKESSCEERDTIKCIWHGLRIFFKNRRGVHILLQAIARTNNNVTFYLQGLISAVEKQKITSFIKENHLEERVFILPPAPPGNIVSSLVKYDIGLIGELPEEENQLYTSSNKLFEYISAGLHVIMPDIPGLRETADEYDAFDLYEPGNYQDLSGKINRIAESPQKINALKQKAKEIAQSLTWQNDYEQVFKKLENISSLQ